MKNLKKKPHALNPQLITAPIFRPKPQKLILYLLSIFCFWNFLYEIISIFDINAENFAENKVHLTWAICSLCITVFFTASFYFLYENRGMIIKRMKKHGINIIMLDYIIMSGYTILIMTLTVLMVYNEKFECSRSNYGCLFSFTTLFLMASFIFVLTYDFKIKILFSAILGVFWGGIFLGNDTKTSNQEFQIVKNIIRLLTDFSLVVVFSYFTQMRKKKQPEKKKTSSKNVKSKSKIKITETCNLIENNDYDEENQFLNFLNQIHSAIVIFDEEMEIQYFNKEIFFFLVHSKNQGTSLSNINNEVNSLTKLELSKHDILEKINEITDIRLFHSENTTIDEELQELLKSHEINNFLGYSEPEPSMNYIFTSLNFKTILKLMKLILNSKSSKLNAKLQEKYLLFSYFYNANISQSQEQFYLTDHPSSLMIEIKASLVHFKGKFHIMFMFTDSTDRKKALELYTINEHKDKLLANVAHEFRTPLNGISTMLELIKINKEKSNEKMMEYLNTASFSVTLLKNYISDILDISQLKNGKFSLNFSLFNIRELIDEISLIISVQAKKKEIIFDSFVDNTVPVMLLTDQTRLTQILLNLLSNSIKFTLKNGFVNLKVFYEESIGVKFEVSDTGIGISKENMKKLFQKYGKIKSEINDALNPQGIGLGLVISKILAEELSPENHKKFEITSEIGKGTTFIFYINASVEEGISLSLSPKSKISILKDKEDFNSIDNENLDIKNKNFEILEKTEKIVLKENLVNENDRCVSSSPRRNKKSQISETVFLRKNKMNSSSSSILFPVFKCLCSKILVVDDDMFNIISLQELLKTLGYDSCYAANGNDAISKVNERNENKCCEDCQNFRIIFLDSNMPILDGSETAKIIKSMESLKNIKIIGCSGDNDLEKLRIAGCDAFLPKPITIKDLQTILNSYRHILSN